MRHCVGAAQLSTATVWAERVFELPTADAVAESAECGMLSLESSISAWSEFVQCGHWYES
jgi:hypothetical protein